MVKFFNHIDFRLQKFFRLLKTLCEDSFWYFHTKETTFPLFSRKQKLNSINEQCIAGDLLENSLIYDHNMAFQYSQSEHIYS